MHETEGGKFGAGPPVIRTPPSPVGLIPFDILKAARLLTHGCTLSELEPVARVLPRGALIIFARRVYVGVEEFGSESVDDEKTTMRSEAAAQHQD